jgi:O-antigen ligase/tetratricopeptide (TPR) repeat protein
LIARPGAWLALALAAVFFLTTGGTYPGIASVDAHVIGQVIAVVVLGGWLVLALVRPAWRPTTPLLLPVALVSAAYLASAVLSQRQRLSLEPTIAGLGWALAFLFVARLLAAPWFRARAAVLLTSFTAIVAFGYIGQVVAEWITWWGLVGHFAIPPLRPSFAGLFFGSPNLVGTALLLLAPLAVTLLWPKDRRHIVAIVLAVASGLAILLSGSRGAWLGAGVGVILALVFAATRLRAGSWSVAGLVARARAQPLLVVPVVIVVAAGVVLAPSLLARFAQGGGDLRLDLWRSALTIFGDHPIFGAGPGTWVQLKVAANPDGVPNLILPHAHDLYVQAAAELGVVGLAALAILGLAGLRRLWTGWRSTAGDGSTGLSTEAAAVAVSLVAFAGQSVVDNLVNLPFVILLLVVLVAWVDGRLSGLEQIAVPTPAARPAGGRAWLNRGSAVAVVGLVGFAVLVPTLIRIDKAAYAAQDGSAAALAGLWPQALDAFNQARQGDPGFTLYDVQAAAALARVGRTADARDQLASAVKLDPVAVNVIGLAALEAQLRDRDAALAHVNEAVALGVGEPVVALNAGLIAEQFGEPDLALDEFATAIAWDPPLAGSSFWTSPARTIPLAQVVEKARTMVAPIDAALILAYAGDRVSARAELAPLPDSDQRNDYVAATLWLDGDATAALASLAPRIDADPQDWYTVAWAARIAYLSGDNVTGDRYARWGIADEGDAAPSIIYETSRTPALSSAWDAGLPGTYPWGVYLRPTAPYLLMPQLTTIGLR